MRPRTAFALGLAGLATAGLGGSVLPADAEVRTFELTLVDGRVVTVSVDVAAGTDIWDIQYPGLVREEIRSIAELPNPAPVSTTPTSPSTTATTPVAPPAGQTTATTPVAPPADQTTATTPVAPPADQTTATTPAPAPGQPEQGPEPKLGAQSGGEQETTGKQRRPAKDADGADSADEPAAADPGGTSGPATRPRPRGAGGLPTLDNPTTSIALPGAAPIGVPNFFIDKFRIPPFLLSIYQAAGMEYGIRWEVLAAINEIETDYGRNLNVSSAGAVGWMQFMPATWKQYGTDANGDKKKDPYNPVDAIFSAARYLRAAGAEEDLRKAIFAYNHADWYVDSVLMRARLIGGLPSNLVGSLTGLTQGMFPVDAKARYADDLDEAEASKRMAKGRNAALPVESHAERRSIDVFARPGAAAVAVQDGKIVKIGRSERLGRFIQLRDAYGNTYTYARLKKIAKSHPVPTSSRRDVEPLALPPRDPKPTAAASAGTHAPATRDATPKAPRTTKVAVPGKQRLYARPTRPSAYKAGGKEQLESQATASDLKLLGLPSDEVEMKELKVGSRVVGGTVLGRIGTLVPGEATHMRFEIRPAGRGAPRIDPKPILDGWKLLESTAVYRAEGRNPFFGPDATPSVGQILLMSKADLERRVLKNPRIEIYGGGRRDVRTSGIDRRVLATLEYLAASGLRPTVTSLDTGHSTYTKSGNVSHHASGNAVDIAKINGIPIMGHQGRGSITDVAVRRLLTLQGTLKPAQIITLMEYDGADNTVAMSDHADHIHVGFTPYFDTDSKAGRQLGAVLKPGQWVKLIDRLGEIDNPTVRLKPSKDALPVKRASRRHRGE